MSRWRAVIVVLSLAAACRDHAAAQAPAGTYVVVATWQETATTIPPGAWIEPSGIDVGPSGRIYVADRRLRRIEVLDPGGTPVRSFGRGTTPEDLVAPEHLAVDEARDRLYVADAGASRIAVYDTSGNRLALWSGVGTPYGVAVAPDGRVAVTDAAASRVHVLDPSGAVVATWGDGNAGQPHLDQPGGLDVTTDGEVLVADRGNARLVAATLDGRQTDDLSLDAPAIAGSEPRDVAATPDGIWVATEIGIAMLDRGGRGVSLRGLLPDAPASAVAARAAFGVYAAVARLGEDPGIWRYLYGQQSGQPQSKMSSPMAVPGFFDGLETVGVGDDGNAYLLDVPPRAQVLSTTGAVLGQMLMPDPIEIDADASGRVFAASGDALRAFRPDGAELWTAEIDVAGPGIEPDIVGVSWDAAAGRVLVLDAAGKRLHSFEADGTRMAEWAPSSSQPALATWSDLAVARDGTLLALDAGSNQVRGWDADRRLVVEIDVEATARRFDVLADGSVVVLGGDGWARRYDRGGAATAAWDATRLELGRGSRPVDVAVDAADRVLVVDGAANVVTVHRWDPAAAAHEPPEVASGCELVPDKTVRPSSIELGETVEVSLVVRGACSSERTLADTALLIDTSMDRSRVAAARRSVEHFLDLVDPAADRVAIQPGDGTGGTLTNDVQRLRRTARRLEPTEDYALAGALEDAEGELFGIRGRSGARKAAILLYGGHRGKDVAYWEWYWVQRAAGQLKRRGAEVFCIALGRDTDMQQLYDVASSRDHVVRSRGAWELDRIYEQIAGRVKPTVLLSSLVITDELPANMEYLAGSARPPAAPAAGVLTWRFTEVPLGGVGARLLVRPMAPGDWPTNLRASAHYVEPSGTTGRLDFPVPVVHVSGPPTPTPWHDTPTADAATATATLPAPPTQPPSPRSSPTPIATSVLFLPLALGEATCDPKAVGLDLALTIDASDQMLLPGGAGRSRMEAAADLAAALVARMDPARDQVALIAFHETADVLVPLGSDGPAVMSALLGVDTRSGSRIDLGLAAARGELASVRHRQASAKAIIVLSAGRFVPAVIASALGESRAARAQSTIIVVVGIGPEGDPEALARLAGRPGLFLASPDAAHLERVAAGLACSPLAWWPWR